MAPGGAWFIVFVGERRPPLSRIIKKSFDPAQL
jgi:hypothetical protein